MSYNITSWKTKKLEDFQLPWSLIEDMDYDVHREKGGLHSIDMPGEGCVLEGTVDEAADTFHITKFELWGEGSGHFFDEVESIFEESTGLLVAVLIWEGGDSIERVTWRDGIMQREPVEL